MTTIRGPLTVKERKDYEKYVAEFKNLAVAAKDVLYLDNCLISVTQKLFDYKIRCVELELALEDAADASCGCGFSADASRGYPKEVCETHTIIEKALLVEFKTGESE